MGSEIPRDAAKRNHCNEDGRDQGDEAIGMWIIHH